MTLRASYVDRQSMYVPFRNHCTNTLNLSASKHHSLFNQIQPISTPLPLVHSLHHKQMV